MNPRDIVFADVDGMVIIPQAPTQLLLEAAEEEASPE